MKKQSGFSLIEIMVALVLGIIVLAAVTTIYMSVFKGSTDTIRGVRLNHDLDSIMQIMVNDIKRSGYWGHARTFDPAGGVLNTNNPFMIAPYNIQTPSTGCVLYSYDANGNGGVDVGGGANELYGFRQNGNTIEMRIGDADCSANSTLWPSFIDTNIVSIPANGLNFTVTTKCVDATDNVTCPSPLIAGHRIAVVRYVTISLRGQLMAEGGIEKTLTESITLRNDLIDVP